MQYSFYYDKKQVLQGLRRHFLGRPEIRILLILVNVYAIVSAILYYMNKIRPEPFLLGSTIWVFLMIAIWFVLPYSIYRKADTFKDNFTIFFSEYEVRLETERGFVLWNWDKFSNYFESAGFFHLYFNARSFFLVPKQTMPDNIKDELRILLKDKIRKS
jgi:hypothetical protein